MKTLKKLLPIAFVSSLTATFPFISSCSCAKAEFSKDISQYFDQSYTRETQIATEEGPMSPSSALKFYLEAIQNNKQIFYDDIFQDLFKDHSEGEVGGDYKIESLKGTLGLTLSDVNTLNNTISIDVIVKNVVIKGKMIRVLPKKEETLIDLCINASAVIKNIPIYLEGKVITKESINLWTFFIDTAKLSDPSFNQWSIVCSGAAKGTIDVFSIDADLNCSFDYDDGSAALKILKAWLESQQIISMSPPLPYLANVVPGPSSK